MRFWLKGSLFPALFILLLCLFMLPQGALAARKQSPASLPSWRGATDYSHLKNPRGAGPGKKVTSAQKRQMIAANKRHNNGLLRSDLNGQPLLQSRKSRMGVKPPHNEVQVDHKNPRSRGGPNTFDNLQLISRKQNRLKSNKISSPEHTHPPKHKRAA